MTSTKYFMYGLRVSQNRYFEWEVTRGRKMPVGIYGDVFCYFNSREGKQVIIGKKIRVNCNESPILVPELTEIEEVFVRESIKDKFGFDGDFQYYFIIE